MISVIILIHCDLFIFKLFFFFFFFLEKIKEKRSGLFFRGK